MKTNSNKEHGWKGGNVVYWKEQAKIRDPFTCKHCHLYDPEIVQVDHIKPVWRFPKLEKVLSNLQTLCPNCHRRKTLKDIKKYGNDQRSIQHNSNN